jgi:Zn-dependent protease
MPIGGMAEFDRIPRLPRQELLITVAGPAVNFVIAAILWLPTRQVASPANNLPSYAFQFFPCLRDLNLWIGLFNLIPAFPMDGGRIVRALLAYGLPYPRATFWAATVGKVVCVVGVIWALSQRNVFAVALFLFIAGAGEAEYRTILMQERRKQEMLEASTTLSREPHDLHPGHN